MIGKIIKIIDFNDNILISESERNYTNHQVKIKTYKKNFDDFISELYKKILILNKYRKINQNIISFGSCFNISSKKNVNFPFMIPSKFEVDKIKIYYNCDKFQYNKIKSSSINIHSATSKNNNGKDFLYKSETFTKEAPTTTDPNNTDGQYLFLSRKSLSGSLDASGAGSGQSFGVNNFRLILSSWDNYIFFESGYSYNPHDTELKYRRQDGYDDVAIPNSYHQHIYPYADLNHKHFLQPTAHSHSYQIPSHNHNYPKHIHKFTTPEHEHEFEFSHSHEVENEFYQSSTIGNISIKINNNLIVDKKIKGEAEFKNYLNSEINIINFICSDKCFLNFYILANGRIKI